MLLNFTKNILDESYIYYYSGLCNSFFKHFMKLYPETSKSKKLFTDGKLELSCTKEIP